MRRAVLMPITAALVLAACSSGDADADGDGEISAGEAASAVATIDGPRPGQYQVKTTILEMNVPGMPAGMGVEMMNRMAEGMAITYCITEADAEKAAREMVGRSEADSDCKFSKFDISGGKIDTEMACATPDGQQMTIKTNGTIGTEGMDVTAELNSPRGNQKMHVVHQRIGDCADTPGT